RQTHNFSRASIGPGGPPMGAFVARAKPPSENQRADDHRNHHGQHDHGCVEENGSLGLANGSMAVEHAAAAAAQQQNQYEAGSYGRGSTSRSESPSAPS